jgi:hypothetical protein
VLGLVEVLVDAALDLLRGHGRVGVRGVLLRLRPADEEVAAARAGLLDRRARERRRGALERLVPRDARRLAEHAPRHPARGLEHQRGRDRLLLRELDRVLRELHVRRGQLARDLARVVDDIGRELRDAARGGDRELGGVLGGVDERPPRDPAMGRLAVMTASLPDPWWPWMSLVFSLT